MAERRGKGASRKKRVPEGEGSIHPEEVRIEKRNRSPRKKEDA